MDFVKPIIRRAEPADAAARLSAQLGYPITEEEARERIVILRDRPDYDIFVAEVGGEVAGFAHMAVAAHLVVDRKAELLALVVDDGQRDHGLGTMLLHACEE